MASLIALALAIELIIIHNREKPTSGPKVTTEKSASSSSAFVTSTSQSRTASRKTNTTVLESTTTVTTTTTATVSTPTTAKTTTKTSTSTSTTSTAPTFAAATLSTQTDKYLHSTSSSTKATTPTSLSTTTTHKTSITTSRTTQGAVVHSAGKEPWRGGGVVFYTIKHHLHVYILHHYIWQRNAKKYISRFSKTQRKSSAIGYATMQFHNAELVWSRKILRTTIWQQIQSYVDVSAHSARLGYHWLVPINEIWIFNSFFYYLS